MVQIPVSQNLLGDSLQDAIQRNLPFEMEENKTCSRCNAIISCSFSLNSSEFVLIQVDLVFNGNGKIVANEKLFLPTEKEGMRAYRPRVLIEHHGNSIENGHYVSWIIKKSGKSYKYYLIDDDCVGQGVPFQSNNNGSEVNIKSPENCNASILLYEKIF